MDPVTQGVLGAAWAQAGSKRRRIRRALWCGIAGGVLPDADTFIRSASDPLMSIEYHRHFTHSLAFIPIGGLVAAGLVHLLSRRRWRFRDIYLPCTLGYASHGLLDACTSYGTRLLWPFSDMRVAWNNIAIVDPLFTIPLLIAVVWAYRARSRRVVMRGLVFAAAYLLIGVVQRQRAIDLQAKLAASRGHVIARGDCKPSIANNILFRSTYEAEGRYYVDAIRVPWWGASKYYEGASTPVLHASSLAQQKGLSKTLRYDLDRFAFFSDNYIIEHPRRPNIIGDLRYAMIPNQLDPLWGIDISDNRPGVHAPFLQLGRAEERVSQRDLFWKMLVGR